ncbi:MerR family transcriptional regulator [Nonomuraea sp. LPB2021202275-12-8]|uniref:MerR family transcriptional regulator n=1 Tax=Nonomuraea sp. LPB2021202275-12-8 TaxID=3120159 RepID=UPI00300CEAF7
MDVTQSAESLYGIEDLARLTGMSARNIRAHQARRLLPPPLRQGRIALYDQGHVQRLETIKSLQRQGYNLVAIEAFLGLHSDAGQRSLGRTVAELAAERSGALAALVRHSIVAHGQDGEVLVLRARPLRAALALRRYGLSAPAALQLLGEVLDIVGRVADDLVHGTDARAASLRQNSPTTDGQAMPAEDLSTVLTEAFRVVVERAAHQASENLLGPDQLADLEMELLLTVDSG